MSLTLLDLFCGPGGAAVGLAIPPAYTQFIGEQLLTHLDSPLPVGSVPGVAPVSPGTATFHTCPTCGYPHGTPPDDHECMCGHPRSAHDDNGGRRKRKPCTVWDPNECTCEDYTE